jgi:limonene-1,2-epoxide hydrolase
VADEFDPEAMIQRFKERAQAVKNRPLPPVAGPEKKRFLERAQVDYMDFAMIGDATAALEDGVLTLRIDLRKG